MTKTNGLATNGLATEPRVVQFATDDPLPEAAVKLPRANPRPGEPYGDWMTSTEKGLGALDHSASLTAEAKRARADELLRRAADDQLFGGSRIGKALIEADRIWRQMNPEISAELGSLGDRSKDLAGRAVRGPARAVSLVLEAIAEDPDRNLSPAEAELLRTLTPDVAEALEQRERVAAEQQEAVLAAVHAEQATYPPGEPGTPIVREET
jgi:hypothetical protein